MVLWACAVRRDYSGLSTDPFNDRGSSRLRKSGVNGQIQRYRYDEL